MNENRLQRSVHEKERDREREREMDRVKKRKQNVEVYIVSQDEICVPIS